MDEQALTEKWAALEAAPIQTCCTRCGAKLLFSWRHDAAFCQECDAWTEEACSNPACEFCATRPQPPSLAQKRITYGGARGLREQRDIG